MKMAIKKKKFFEIIALLIILLVMRGPCGCFGDECGGGGGYTPRYYWFCPPTNVIKCAVTNPGGCYKLTQMGTC